MKKKGSSQVWWVITAAIIAFIVVILIIVWFQGSGGKLFKGIDEQITGLKSDKDNDGVGDLSDQCPCDPAVGSELEQGQICSPAIPGCVS
ncbi:MAG: hypothetical protein Q8R37_00985 [Nanoarchaeota archaeon]|nr:hypothetical protein [Nanoarchaeota archaeon]